MTFAPGERAHYFEAVAAEFGRASLPYPPEVVDRILGFAGATRPLRMLEIGSGTGEATALFAPRAASMVCLEPGSSLVTAARGNFCEQPHVQFVQETFDDWDPQDRRFELVFAARALHWVREDLRFTKTAEVLAPGGVLAIFHKQRLTGASPCARAVEALIAATGVSPNRGDAGVLRAQFAASCHYTDVQDTTRDYEVEVDARTYVAAARSERRLGELSVTAREELLATIAEVIAAHGGTLRVSLRFYLTMARRRRGPRWWREATARGRAR